MILFGYSFATPSLKFFMMAWRKCDFFKLKLCVTTLHIFKQIFFCLVSVFFFQYIDPLIVASSHKFWVMKLDIKYYFWMSPNIMPGLWQ